MASHRKPVALPAAATLPGRRTGYSPNRFSLSAPAPKPLACRRDRYARRNSSAKSHDLLRHNRFAMPPACPVDRYARSYRLRARPLDR